MGTGVALVIGVSQTDLWRCPVKTSKLFGTMLVLSMALAVGCNKGSSGSGSKASIRASSGSAPNYQSQGIYYTASTGSVFLDASYSSQFTTMVQNLVAASIDPSVVGQVSPVSGVKLRGYVELDSSGNVVVGRSSMSLEIDDEWTGQQDDGQTIPPLYINLPARSGRATGGSATLVFADNARQVTLSGGWMSNGYSGSTFAGQIAYNNTTSAIQGAPLHSASPMANFQIDTCGFFRCQ